MPAGRETVTKQRSMDVERRRRANTLEREMRDPTSICNVDCLLDTVSALVSDCDHESLRRLKNIEQYAAKYKPLAMQINQLRMNVEDFHFIKLIGAGAFGEVQLVRHKSSSQVYAMKRLSKFEMMKRPDSAFFWEERHIMAHANSEWIVQLHFAFQILKKPMPRNSLRDGGATNNSAGDTNKTTGNPSPIPEEFVPAPEKTEERSLCADLSKINKLFDFLESSRTDDVDLGNTVVDGVGMENLSTAVEAWKEVPNRNLKISFGDPEEFMDNLDFMRISRRKAKITFEKAREKRLEQERMAALEATKLTEEKSMEDPSSVPVPVPGNDSPIHFSAEERTEVDRMQAVKEGEEDQEASGSVVALTPKRYIPTDKEWDEQCRFKAQKSPTTVDQMPPATTMTAKRYIPTTKEWDEQCRFKMETEMNATLPTKKLEAESRNGNITHYGANVAPTPMESQPIEGEQKDRQVKKGNVIRYTIEELLKLEPQPEDLEVPAEVALINNNLLKDT